MTLDAQKAGADNPSLVDIVTMLDRNKLDFLLPTETLLHQRSGALTHTLRNRGYKIFYHPANVSSHQDFLSEARLPTQLTHPGGGCWLAYTKQNSWSSLVKSLILPPDCPRTATCAVELALLIGAKAVVISCYLSQSMEEHAQVCRELARLPPTLPQHFPMLDGDVQGG